MIALIVSYSNTILEVDENLRIAKIKNGRASIANKIVNLRIHLISLRELLAEKFSCLSCWKEPPAFDTKLTTLSSSVGEGLKKRFKFKKMEMKA